MPIAVPGPVEEPDCDLSLLVVLEQAVTVVVPQEGHGPRDVVQVLILVCV